MVEMNWTCNPANSLQSFRHVLTVMLRYMCTCFNTPEKS